MQKLVTYKFSELLYDHSEFKFSYKEKVNLNFQHFCNEMENEKIEEKLYSDSKYSHIHDELLNWDINVKIPPKILRKAEFIIKSRSKAVPKVVID